MQRAVDVFSQLTRDAIDGGDIFGAGRRNAAHAAKTLQQTGAPLGADTRNVFELAAAIRPR